MKLGERARRKLKREETALKNRMHRIADVLFPGFLNESLSGLLPFSVSCLNLMESGCSVVRIRQMRAETLAKRLKAGRTHNPDQVAVKLKELAASVLAPTHGTVPYMEKSLAAKARHMVALRENLRLEENEMARCLVQTPGFFLTSITGLGVVLAEVRQQPGEERSVDVVRVGRDTVAAAVAFRADAELAGHLPQLAVQVAPLAHAQVVEVLVAAHPPEPVP